MYFMKKRKIALRGKILSCLFPLLLIIAAVYLFATASFPVSSGGEVPAYSVFDIIERITEG